MTENKEIINPADPDQPAKKTGHGPLIYDKGDIVRLSKPHACGANEFLIERRGVDIKLTCLKCDHKIWLKRPVFEKKLRKIKDSEGKFINPQRKEAGPLS